MLTDKVHHGLARLMIQHGFDRLLAEGAIDRLHSSKMRRWGYHALSWIVGSGRALL